MTIRRGADPQDNFQILPHQTSRDTRLSFKARGLLVMMLSYPADWIFNREWLAKQSPHEGVSSVRAALNELEECGYLVRERIHTGSGQFTWVQTLYRTPRQMEPKTLDASIRPDDPEVTIGDLPSVANQPMVPTSANTDNAQVAPSVGYPPVANRPLEEEFSNEDCDEEKTSTRSFSANEPEDQNRHPRQGTSARGTRLPKPFPVTESMRSWASDKAPHCGLSDHEAFCDYWWSTPGARGRKVDWEATWRNWMRKAQADASRYRPSSNGHASNGRKPSTTDERVQAALDLAQRFKLEDEQAALFDARKEINA